MKSFGGGEKKSPSVLAPLAKKINKGQEINSYIKLERTVSKLNTFQSSHCATSESLEQRASGKRQKSARRWLSSGEVGSQISAGNMTAKPQELAQSTH